MRDGLASVTRLQVRIHCRPWDNAILCLVRRGRAVELAPSNYGVAIRTENGRGLRLNPLPTLPPRGAADGDQRKLFRNRRG